MEDDLVRLERNALEDQRAVQNVSQLVERGLMDVDDPDFAARFEPANHKRNISDTALKRARARLGSTRVYHTRDDRWTRGIVEDRSIEDNVKFRRFYVNALVDKIKITDQEVVIRGKASNILAAAKTERPEQECPCVFKNGAPLQTKLRTPM